MGQARNRLARLIAADPYCIYCGGRTPADSCDHCPPTAIFDRAFRPKGMEFAACSECHDGTRQLDLVAAMMSRVFSNPDDPPPVDDVRKHIGGFIRNLPELAWIFGEHSEETFLNGRKGHVINLRREPRLHRAMNAFAARMGLALFRFKTGAVAPADSEIRARWYSNSELDSDSSIEDLLRALGAPDTLQMGRSQVANQFRFWAECAPDDPSLFFGFAAFRESFGVLAMITPKGSRELPEDSRNTYLFEPGFLKGFSI